MTDIGEVCVMIILMMWLLMLHADNLDMEEVRYLCQ